MDIFAKSRGYRYTRVYYRTKSTYSVQSMCDVFEVQRDTYYVLHNIKQFPIVKVENNDQIRKSFPFIQTTYSEIEIYRLLFEDEEGLHVSIKVSNV